MKNLTSKIISPLLVCVMIIASNTNANCQLTKIWETEASLMAPESVVYDFIRNCLYVSNFNDEGGFIKKPDTLHNESISKVDLEGNIVELRWIDGLHNPTGITIYRDRLYIVEREGVAIANMETRKIEKRIPVKDAVFLNDIVVAKDGSIYLSDTFKPGIFRIKNGKSEVWYTDTIMNSPNGLFIAKNHLLVGTRGTANLLSISLTNKSTQVIASDISDNIDGLKIYNKGYLLSWNSELFQFEKGNKTLLYELDDKNDFLADFEWIKEQQLIIVPLLMSNKVIALKLDNY